MIARNNLHFSKFKWNSKITDHNAKSYMKNRSNFANTEIFTAGKRVLQIFLSIAWISFYEYSKDIEIRNQNNEILAELWRATMFKKKKRKEMINKTKNKR